MDEDERFVRDLVELVPALKPGFEQHRVYYDEVLSHVFFGDVSEWAVAACTSGRLNSDLATFLDVLETGCRAGGEDTRALIDQSFIENICGQTQLASKLPSALLERYRVICGM